jgi:hypothetical protein
MPTTEPVVETDSGEEFASASEGEDLAKPSPSKGKARKRTKNKSKVSVTGGFTIEARNGSYNKVSNPYI